MTGNTSYITIFDATTGAIRCRTAIAAGTEDNQCRDGEAWVEGWHDNTEARIDPVTLDVLPLLAMDVDIEVNRVSGIPAGTTALVNGEIHTIDDGEIEFEVTYPQTFTVMLLNPLYPPLTIEVPCEAEA